METENIPKEGWRRQLHMVIFGAETFWGKFFDVVLLCAIFISVSLVVMESEKTLRTSYGSFFDAAEWFFTILFTVEFLARLVSSRKPSRYVFSFFGMVDLVSILPTYLGLLFAGAGGLLVVRALRLLRLFLIFKVARFSNAGNTLMTALRNSSAKIIVFVMAVLTMVLIVGTLMYIVEGDATGFSSIPRGMYWAVVTMTTVGYGDIVPGTPLGKFIASAIMIMGYGIIAVPTGIVSTEIAATVLAETKAQVCPHCQTTIEKAANK